MKKIVRSLNKILVFAVIAAISNFAIAAVKTNNAADSSTANAVKTKSAATRAGVASANVNNTVGKAGHQAKTTASSDDVQNDSNDIAYIDDEVSDSKNSIPQDDPFERYNRNAYQFNHDIDRAIIRPIAQGYDFILPSPVKKGVTNFFNNLDEVPTVLNDALQANPKCFVTDIWRLVINTTIGIGGLFDVAEHLGMKKNHQDFGLTLTKWGYKQSAYLVLPFLGPSTVRDTLAIPVNFVTSVNYNARPTSFFIYVNGLYWINLRANFLKNDKLIDEAFDPYIFMRDAYLQHQAYLARGNSGNGEETSYYKLDNFVTDQQQTLDENNKSQNTTKKTKAK